MAIKSNVSLKLLRLIIVEKSKMAAFKMADWSLI